MFTHTQKNSNREVELACMAACIHAHKLAKVVDEESVDALESRMMSEETSASEHALVQCATFYALAGGAESWKAKGMAERALQMKPDLHQARTLLGWIELGGGGGAGGDDDWDDDFGVASPGAGAQREDTSTTCWTLRGETASWRR